MRVYGRAEIAWVVSISSRRMTVRRFRPQTSWLTNYESSRTISGLGRGGLCEGRWSGCGSESSPVAWRRPSTWSGSSMKFENPAAEASPQERATRTRIRPAKLKLFSSRWLASSPIGFESRRPRQPMSTLAAPRMGCGPFSTVFSAILGSRLRFSSMNVRGRGLTSRTRTATRPAGLAWSTAEGV